MTYQRRPLTNGGFLLRCLRFHLYNALAFTLVTFARIVHPGDCVTGPHRDCPWCPDCECHTEYRAARRRWLAEKGPK